MLKILSVVVLLGVLSGCGSKSNEAQELEAKLAQIQTGSKILTTGIDANKGAPSPAASASPSPSPSPSSSPAASPSPSPSGAPVSSPVAAPVNQAKKCLAGGINMDNNCFYMAPGAESCTQVCANRGGYSAATNSLKGSYCWNAINKLIAAGVNVAPSVNYIESGTLGCAWGRLSYSPFYITGPGDPGADAAGMVYAGIEFRRVCACKY